MCVVSFISWLSLQLLVKANFLFAFVVVITAEMWHRITFEFNLTNIAEDSLSVCLCL